MNIVCLRLFIPAECGYLLVFGKRSPFYATSFHLVDPDMWTAHKTLVLAEVDIIAVNNIFKHIHKTRVKAINFLFRP